MRGYRMKVKLAEHEIIADDAEYIQRRSRLQLITGGKDGNGDNPTDWLSPLPNGTIFLFYDKRNPFDPNLGQAKILYRTEKSIYIGSVVNVNRCMRSLLNMSLIQINVESRHLIIEHAKSSVE